MPPTVTYTASDSPSIVVVGAGMAAHRFCEQLVERGLHQSYRVVLVGDEPEPPYDRIRLGERVAGSSFKLELRPPRWYREHGIELRLSTRVVRVDREARQVALRRVRTDDDNAVVVGASGEDQRETDSIELIDYSRLVLATGSSARVPAGVELDGELICVYRSARDADTICTSMTRIARNRAPACVVAGGGLLGLEVARDLLRFGGSVEVLEASTHLLSRQLDVRAARVLAERLEQEGIETRVQAKFQSIKRRGDQVCVRLEDGEELLADFVVVAVGVQPNDAIAREAGLKCHFRGGIWVNDRLQTEDPHIDAIGECAAVNGEAIGLAAPCFDMANTAADRLAGIPSRYKATARVTKLKLDLIEVTVVGDAMRDDPGFIRHEWNGSGAHRSVVTRRGRLIGATSIGAWTEMPTVVSEVLRGGAFRAASVGRFVRGDLVFPEARRRLEMWSDDVPICTCTGATCGAVRAAIKDGHVTVGAIRARTGASSVCGSCEPLVAELAGQRSEPRRREVALGVAAAVAVALGVAAAFLGPVGYATSVTSDLAKIDVLWRDETLQQITGFSLLGIVVVSMLLSLRKRVSWFKLGTYRGFRVLHSVLGTATLIGLLVHTGFRLGANLDRVLAVTFLGVLAVGVLTAAVVALEPRMEPAVARRLRSTALRTHQILVWPLPVLLAVHIIRAFYF